MLSNIGLVVALSARAAQFPEEYDLLHRIEEAYIPGSSIYKRAVDWGPGGFLAWTNHIADTFGLVMVGSGRRHMPHGYIRLPSSVRANGWIDRRGRIYLARFQPDPVRIRSWACSESS